MPGFSLDSHGPKPGLEALRAAEIKTAAGMEALRKEADSLLGSFSSLADAANAIANAANAAASNRASSGSSTTGDNKQNTAVDAIADTFAQSGAQLNAFMSRFGDQFNRAAGTAVEALKRIESHLRFQAGQEALDKLQSKIRDGIAGSAAKSKESLTTIDRALLNWGPSIDKGITALRAFQKTANFLANLKSIERPLDKLSALDLAHPVGQIRILGSAITSTANSARNLGREIVVALGVAGVIYKASVAIKDFVAGGIKGASDLNETLSKTDVILGTASGDAKAFSEEMAKNFGIVKRSTLDAEAAFGGLAKNLGNLNGSKLAQFAKDNTKLAADLSSQANITFKEAVSALQTGLAGNQSDTLRELGAIITETTTKQYALAHGIAKGSAELSEQEKFMARAGLIALRLKDASGDLENTVNSTANAYRRSTGGLENFSVAMGQILLPAVDSAIAAFNDLLGATVKAFESNKSTIESWAYSVSGAVNVIGVAARNSENIWKILTLRIGAWAENAIAYVNVIGPNFAQMTAYIGRNWQTLLIDLATAQSAAFTNLGQNAVNFGKALIEAIKGNGFEYAWTPLLEGFKSASEALPELIKPRLVDVEKSIAEIMGEIEAKEMARALTIKAKAGKAASEAEAIVGGKSQKSDDKGPQFAKGAERGSKEAYAELLKLSGTSSKDSDSKKIARNSDKQTNHLARIATLLDKLPKGNQVEVVGI